MVFLARSEDGLGPSDLLSVTIYTFINCQLLRVVYPCCFFGLDTL